MFPLLSEEEFEEEYATDKTVRAVVGDETQGTDFDRLCQMFKEMHTYNKIVFSFHIIWHIFF